MFDHVLLRVADRAASERFYNTVLEPLAVESFEPLEGITRWSNIGVTESDAEHPVTRGVHIGCVAPSREHVDAFWDAGIRAGYLDDGEPGPRRQYGESYYGGFLRDPDGNSIEAVHDDRLASEGLIDHLWIRVSSLAAATGFYNTIAPHTGFVPDAESRERAQCRGDSGSFALLEGPPTEHAHIAFSAPDRTAVEHFHKAVTAAGYREHGAPGERSDYAPGYYAAFAFDPDGNNVEAVCLPQ